MGSPQKNFDRGNFKFGLKFSVLRSITSGLVAVSLWDFFQSTSREAGVITWVQFSQCPPPKICTAKKSFKIFRDFWHLSTFIAYISGTDLHIKHLKKKLDQPQPLPCWTKQTWWTLVHKQKSSIGAYWATQVDIFRETFRPLGGAAPSNFIHTRDWPRLLSAHPIWDRGPPPQKKKNYREN